METNILLAIRFCT